MGWLQRAFPKTQGLSTSLAASGLVVFHLISWSFDEVVQPWLSLLTAVGRGF